MGGKHMVGIDLEKSKLKFVQTDCQAMPSSKITGWSQKAHPQQGSLLSFPALAQKRGVGPPSPSALRL